MPIIRQYTVRLDGELYAYLSIHRDRAELVRFGFGPTLLDDLTRSEAAELLRMYRRRRPAITITR